MKQSTSIIYGKDGKEKHRFENCELYLTNQGFHTDTSPEKTVIYKLKKGECIVIEKTKK